MAPMIIEITRLQLRNSEVRGYDGLAGGVAGEIIWASACWMSSC